MNKAQKILIDNKCDDLVINDRDERIDPENRIYVSDIMLKFSKLTKREYFAFEFAKENLKRELSPDSGRFGPEVNMKRAVDWADELIKALNEEKEG